MDSKLRLMCSYGGHITPFDNSLFYIGGDTRIVSVDRHSSLTNIFSHLSLTLLHGRKPFTLKYHLPNEDLDNLITVSTDEDLQNMIEEYDRLSLNLSPSPSRLRLFLFLSKPETAVSMGNFDNSDDHAWFVEALNNSGILSRVVSDSAALVDNCLLNLDDDDDHVSAASSNGGENTNSTKEHLIDMDYSMPVEDKNNVTVKLPPIEVDDNDTAMSNNIKSEVSDKNEQHQFVYIQGQVPISSYYPVYAPQSYQQLHQYPVYAMPIGLGSIQSQSISNIAADTKVAMAVAPNPAFVQIHSDQFQQRYVSLPQNLNIHQTIYGYEYNGAQKEQIYYTPQHPADAIAPPQYTNP
ncbi:protein PAL OF QUIRKY-like [Vicia villosa]|uniref:protein PAL OF QUIRKY-like n=1 Tax=Vicia villosa TaxID=3911 RepID=UPI00273B2075|nr:protein PAL OF QUIRKY-like [Vicia villosa]